MSSRCIFILLLFQVTCGAPRLLLPFLPTPEGATMNNMVSSRLNLPDSDNNSGRRPRHLVTILSLLWPQVVGPMHDGVIHEHSYNEIPKTMLETYLDTLRVRSRHEVSTRQLIRNIINNGPIPKAQILAHPPAGINGPSSSVHGGLIKLPAEVHFDVYQQLGSRHDEK